jgi:hypothetical protein
MRVVTMTYLCEAYVADGVGEAKYRSSRRLAFDERVLEAVMSGGGQRSGAGRFRAVSRWLEEF